MASMPASRPGVAIHSASRAWIWARVRPSALAAFTAATITGSWP